VTKKPEPAPESQKKPEEARTPLLSHMNLAMVQWLMLAFGILVFLIWILLRSDIFLSIVDALLIIAFVLVVAGVFVAWFSQRQ
jgi:glucan phosphoethanolaminetransferase (alkaline phosphatase superfamily)